MSSNRVAFLKAFHEADRDKSGTVSRGELAGFLRRRGVHFSQLNVSSVF